MCQSLEIPLKPLNLHQKIQQLDEATQSRLMLSSLRISNKNLDIEDSLQWIGNILPDVPSYIDSALQTVTFYYQSSFVGSYLIITLRAPLFGDDSDPNNESANFGRIDIQTDNYSVLTIMKDQITAQAN